MQDEIKALIEKAEGDKSAHEALEISLELKALADAKGRDPVLFLLDAMRREELEIRWLRQDHDRFSKISEWVNADRAHSHMVGGELGHFCSDIVFAYLERTFAENEAEIRASLVVRNAEIHAWCEERRRKVAAGEI